MKRILLLLPLAVILLGILAFSSTDNTSFESPNFVDGRFFNLNRIEVKGLGDFYDARSKTEWAEWPEWIVSDYGDKPPAEVENDAVRITMINHATVLIQGYGLNILTDPIYSDRCSPVQFAGPQRVINPGIRFEELPAIDLIIISHDHYDHLDSDTLEQLIARDNPRILMGLGVSRHIDSSNMLEMDWWDSTEINQNLTAHFVPVQHFSGRGLFDRYSTLWGGYVLQLGQHQIYFGGDSGYADHYRQTFERFGAMDLALLPIGAYAPRSFMGDVHMDPVEAVQAHQDLHASKSIGIHYGTFQLTAEPINEPVELLTTAHRDAQLPDNAFITLEFGESITLPSIETTEKMEAQE